MPAKRNVEFTFAVLPIKTIETRFIEIDNTGSLSYDVIGYVCSYLIEVSLAMMNMVLSKQFDYFFHVVSDACVSIHKILIDI